MPTASPHDLRFAILTHDHPFLHWDLLIETAPDQNLRTWRLHQQPDVDGPILAEPLPDHRRIYLDYEGPISNNRGTVTQWDAGNIELLEVELDRIQIQLHGQKISGVYHVERDGEAWQFRSA